ncbi:MAG: DUF4382 domain-containing protein [Deltaproteobacteria bacterium]|nr:DUF4382 domain-containing protein [Deltaproteobacteria bacterium]
MNVSLAAAPGFLAGTTFATSMAIPSAPPTSSNFDNVWVTVNKIALIPVDSIPISERNKPDPNGELEVEDSPGDSNGFVTVTLLSPLVIDLQNAPDPLEAAQLLTMFENVPVGEYSKIRVYYDSVIGDPGDVLFHPTAHYHFDVHFVGGNLVIPMETSEQGMQFYSIFINVVGLKIHQAGNSGKFLMRPQVFATVDSAMYHKYKVHGVANDVNHSTAAFNILTSGDQTIPTVYFGSTKWLYLDYLDIDLSPTRESDLAGLGPVGLDNTAIVDVIGTFSPEKVLQAEEVDIRFPDTLEGNVFLGWNPADNTFTLRLTPPPDNVVFPKPSKAEAYYDNAVSGNYEQLPNPDIAIIDNVGVKARGYITAGGIEAYWISVGP